MVACTCISSLAWHRFVLTVRRWCSGEKLPRPVCPAHAKSLYLERVLLGPLLLLDALLGLVAHDTTAPSLARVLVLLHVTVLDRRDQLRQLALVLRPNLSQS